MRGVEQTTAAPAKPHPERRLWTPGPALVLTIPNPPANYADSRHCAGR